MPQLDPTWFASQLFWLLLCIVALYFILSRRILPPLQEIVARRDQTVTSDLSQAESLKAQAEHARHDYERMLADARERAQQVMSDTELDQKAKAEQIEKSLDRDIEKKLSEATASIAAKKTEMMQALAPAAAELSGLIVEKLTKHAPGSDRINRALGALSKG